LKYISIIDQLGIDINAIITLDDAKIIRLQKQLKANAVLNNTSNLGELALLIDQLKDETIREHHVFIEQHDWLKQIISGNYSNIPQSSINLYEDNIEDLYELKHFLAPYFRAHLKPFLTETLNKGKYILLFNVIKNYKLFTEEIEQIIINFFSAKLNFATVYIQNNRLELSHAPVGYITNRNFINCLSQYPNSFTEEVNDLNSVIIDTYNSKRKNVNDSDFNFVAKTMVAFGALEVSSYMLKDILTSNAEIAKPYAYKTTGKSKSGTTVGIWSIVVFILIIIRLASLGINSSNRNDSRINIDNQELFEAVRKIKQRQDYQKKIDLPLQETLTTEDVVETTLNNKPIISSEKITLPDVNSKQKAKDHTRFIYSLKLKTNRKEPEIDNSAPTKLNEFTNPYPKTFNKIEAYAYGVANNSEYSLVKNSSSKDLIVFKLQKGIDQSIYIPKDEKIYINLKPEDSLLFYTGNGFVVDNFSHFKNDAELSKLYVVKTIGPKLNHEINVLPYKLSIYEKSIINSDIKIKDTSKLDVIDSKNINLNGINIDKIYTNWYKKKHN
jgi:hypothetical protein